MQLQPILDLLRQELGLDAQTISLRHLESHVHQRILHLGLNSISAYCELVSRDGTEWSLLLDQVLVPETWFFRGGELFRTLADWLRLHRRESVMHRPLRVLSVPSSSGEEIYSLAIALKDLGMELRDLQLYGVDANPRIIEKARQGIYSGLSFRQFDPRLHSGLFQLLTTDRWQLSLPLRQRVQFRVGNLLEPQFLSGESLFDLILCRNLFIYFDVEAKRRAMLNLQRLLAPGGRLCLSAAEATVLPMDQFHRVGAPEWFCYQRFASPKPTLPQRWPETKLVAVATPVEYSTVPTTKTKTSTVEKDNKELLQQARTLADQGDAVRAQDLIAIAIKHHRSAEAYTLQGILQQVAGDLAPAEKSFRDALYLQPDHDEALTHLALLYDQQGKAAQAKLLRQRLRRLSAQAEATA